ncbi:transposase [Actinomadura graeca]|uniref:Transposase n=1 Tax=Actinomadura graeca TaxID=2750812 RepID=A0ABX8R4G8_9ACTN|nr:transposase [Actinomadura graeca]QXJ25971.1 transposase [Actinomadura graeca]
MWIRDRLAGLCTDDDFAGWYPADGRRGLSPAVRCRIDWKYALGLELTDPGFDHSVLCEFRDRMAWGDRADGLLAVMVDRLVAAGLVKRRGGCGPIPRMCWRRCGG